GEFCRSQLGETSFQPCHLMWSRRRSVDGNLRKPRSLLVKEPQVVRPQPQPFPPSRCDLTRGWRFACCIHHEQEQFMLGTDMPVQRYGTYVQFLVHFGQRVSL